MNGGGMFPLGSDSVEVVDDWVRLDVTEGNVAELVGSAAGVGVEFIFARSPMMMPTAPRTSAAATTMTVGTTHRDPPRLSP
jgi:hypothetical protein